MKPTFLILVIAIVNSGFAENWPAFRGNLARTGFYPGPAGCPTGGPLWKTSLGCEVISSPSVVDNVLYIGGRDSCIHAVDCGTGGVLWKTKTGGWVDASPLVDGNRIIVGSRDSTMYVLDKNSGQILGRMRAGVQLSSPALTAAGDIISGLGLPSGGISSYKAAALGKESAEPQWSVALPQYTYSSPAVHGQAVVIGATDGRFYGIGTDRRDTIWSLATGGAIYLSTPAIDDTIVYLAPGDEDRNVYAVNLLTGRVAWKSEGLSPAADTLKALEKRTSVRTLPSADLVRLLKMSPALRKKTIQRLGVQGIVLPRVPEAAALGKRTAGMSKQFIPLGGMKTSSVAVGANNVYVIQKDIGFVLNSDSVAEYRQQFFIQAIDKRTGAPAWKFGDWRASPQQGYCSSPVATRSMVYFGWGEGRMYGLDAASGRKIWEDSLEGNILSSPAIANGRLYMATMAGNIYAYDLLATPPGLDFNTSTYCYPNPAKNGVSHLQVYVAAKAELSIVVYNSVEKPVFRVNRTLAADEKYAYDWDVRGVANGVYFAIVKVRYDDGREDKKILKIAVLN
jgi:eukaryotic-like serine/threonine-protein kinase